MKLKKYFSAVMFFSVLIHNQIFFCSKKSSNFDNNPVDKFTKKITAIFQNLIQPSISVRDLDSLYHRYELLIPNLERSLFDYVCNNFISKGNSFLIDQAVKQDISSITTTFGHAVQSSLIDFLNLYTSYQEKIGSFEKELFLRVFNKYCSLTKKDFLVDACKDDIVKITSHFGTQLKNVVIIFRNCKVIESLGEALSTDTKKLLVFSAILKQIDNEKKITNSYFFPELLLPAFEHVFNESKYSSSSIDDLVNIITQRHDDLVTAFMALLPPKFKSLIQIEKYIKPFCETLKNYAEENKISGLELNLYEPRLKMLFLYNLFNMQQS